MTLTEIAREMSIRLAAQFIMDSKTRHEYLVYRHDLSKRGLPLPQEGRAVKVTLEFVDEGVLCEAGAE